MDIEWVHVVIGDDGLVEVNGQPVTVLTAAERDQIVRNLA